TLWEKIAEFFSENRKTIKLTVPSELDKLVGFIKKNTEVIEYSFNHQLKEHEMHIVIPNKYIGSIQKQIDDYYLLNYYNGKSDDLNKEINSNE
ncbi:MAG: hypothetical protein PHR06_11285, partial [Candidatus Cloacimonetes bacterium]|nr:hypothetical protein [Candidatus Cloacimonadota bacterium]